MVMKPSEEKNNEKAFELVVFFGSTNNGDWRRFGRRSSAHPATSQYNLKSCKTWSEIKFDFKRPTTHLVGIGGTNAVESWAAVVSKLRLRTLSSVL